jgi:hypothetical protein
MNGEDLERVNFQTPTVAVKDALAALLGVPLDANGDVRDCVIVSTFSTRNVRTLPFRRFTAYGAHGVAGATAFATPALPGPVYFNDQVVPDRSRTESSEDGGVIWTGVPAGTYTIRARHDSRRFARFTATCRAGRVVNANPVWGLHELGARNRATPRARFGVSGSAVTLERLRITRAPKGAVARLACTGPRCPFKARRVATGRDVAVRRLRAGQTLTLSIAGPAHDTKVVRWRLRAGRQPTRRTLCIPLGYTKARASCSIAS